MVDFAGLVCLMVKVYERVSRIEARTGMLQSDTVYYGGYWLTE